jgi:ankyrin repeat protein
MNDAFVSGERDRPGRRGARPARHFCSFGETPKDADETSALPNPSAWRRIMNRFCKSMTNGGARLWQGVNMKTKLWVLTLFLASAAAAVAQNSNLTSLLQQGLLEEQGNRNFDAAIADYQSLAALFDKDRQLAATAIFRLGECYRAQGKTNEATAQYQRIVREFSDQNTLALMSRQNLVGLGAPPAAAVAAPPENQDAKLWESLSHLSRSELEKVLPTLAPDLILANLLQERDLAEARLRMSAVQFGTNNPDLKGHKEAVETLNRHIQDKIDNIMLALRLRAGLSKPGATSLLDTARQKQQQLLEEQIKVVEQEFQMKQAQYKQGLMTAEEPLVTQEKLLELKRQLAALEGGQAVSPPMAATTDDEDQEIQRIKQMIQNSPDLINAPSEGHTPLRFAASKGQLHVATFLLDHGADINPKNGGTPLDAAAENAQKTMVELLLNRGADIDAPNGKDGAGGTALGTAAQNGYEAVVEVLLAHKADVNRGRRDGFTPLMEAAGRGRDKIVKMLLAAKANPNVEEKDGNTPLIWAARDGSAECVKELLAAGADPNKQNSRAITALSYAVELGSAETVKLLLAAKADPNGGSSSTDISYGGRNTPLILAIHNQDLVIAELLLKAGANPNAQGSVVDQNWSNQLGDHAHMPPLWLAIQENQLPMVNLLLKFKADPNDSQRDGHPLIWSALSNSEIVQALLDAGAKVNVSDGGYWPLERAVAQDFVPTVEVLLKHGADPNGRDGNGDAALHIANNHLNRKIYELLLAHHADPNAQSNRGQTPLQVVNTNAAHGPEIAELLRQHGALENPPRWNVLEVNRLSGSDARDVYRKGTNDWNHFTLLETILNYYVAGDPVTPHVDFQNGIGRSVFRPSPMYQEHTMPFPDLSRIVIVRPSRDSTNEARINVNLLDNTNGIDCSKDVPLEFGDMVEIPEREHSLGDPPVTLAENQVDTMVNFLKGHAQLLVHDQKVELPLDPFGDKASLYNVLHQSEAQKVILSSSDLSRVKVTRADTKTGEKHEWVLDCTSPPSSDHDTRPRRPALPNSVFASPTISLPSNDLHLRDGDVIEIPEKS